MMWITKHLFIRVLGWCLLILYQASIDNVLYILYCFDALLLCCQIWIRAPAKFHKFIVATLPLIVWSWGFCGSIISGIDWVVLMWSSCLSQRLTSHIWTPHPCWSSVCWLYSLVWHVEWQSIAGLWCTHTHTHTDTQTDNGTSRQITLHYWQV